MDHWPAILNLLDKSEESGPSGVFVNEAFVIIAAVFIGKSGSAEVVLPQALGK